MYIAQRVQQYYNCVFIIELNVNIWFSDYSTTFGCYVVEGIFGMDFSILKNIVSLISYRITLHRVFDCFMLNYWVLKVLYSRFSMGHYATFY